MDNSIFYNFTNVLSYNALFNFILGERGVGKTYGALKFVINRFIKSGEQFVYLRRYKSELKKSVPHLFDAIVQNEEFPDNNLFVKGDTMYIDGKVAGYAIALSTSNILKSTSFSKVKTIIYDEFLIDRGTYHYLSNEIISFLDLYETIARLREVRVLFLGNAISQANPYFTYFDLHLPYNSTFATFRDGLIVVNYIKNLEYREVKKNSKFGKLIEDTSYSKYAIENEFLRDSNYFIKHKTPNSKFFFTLVINQEKIGVWRDRNIDTYFLSFDIDPNCPISFALSNQDHTDNTVLIKSRTNPYFKLLIEHYKVGSLCFESQKIKGLVMDHLARCVI